MDNQKKFHEGKYSGSSSNSSKRLSINTDSYSNHRKGKASGSENSLNNSNNGQLKRSKNPSSGSSINFNEISSFYIQDNQVSIPIFQPFNKTHGKMAKQVHKLEGVPAGSGFIRKLDD